jgi:hypothetical protein
MRVELWFYDRAFIERVGHPDSSTMDGVDQLIECDVRDLVDPSSWVCEVMDTLGANNVICVREARS